MEFIDGEYEKMNKRTTKDLVIECIICISISFGYIAAAVGLTLLNIYVCTLIPFNLLRFLAFATVGIFVLGCFIMAAVMIGLLIASIKDIEVSITGEE